MGARLIFQGDCLERLKELENSSVDSIVTDPPYGLSFMGKKWDYDVPSKEIWLECLRVLKPGGHLLAFGGTRTYHRLVVNIEDAGFEIRDQIQWLYGSGFPKSHNIKEGEFKGWGSALKPANEPICVARKPLEKSLTLAQNVLKYGTGAINIDASRIGMQPATTYTAPDITGNQFNSDVSKRERKTVSVPAQGRWPANIILDEVAAEMLDEQSGESKSTKRKTGQGYAFASSNINVGGGNKNHEYTDSGGASRFFYVAKASKRERGDGNLHPTVKPIKLMEYLIKLVTPPNGTVLDPFMGSGTTGVACKKLVFEFVGIELNEEYFEIAKRRTNLETNTDKKDRQIELPME